MIKVAILGAGKIGSAVYKILYSTAQYPYTDVRTVIMDANERALAELKSPESVVVDFTNEKAEDIAGYLRSFGVIFVINALPFFLNDKVAKAAAIAGCHYIDFTEDDIMADKVQEIYKNTNLNCAVKCGLAPGFINYIGYSLVKQLDTTDSLTISVGALPRTISFSPFNPEKSYNLTWSIDGLVNEYIRPCRVKIDGEVREVEALGGINTLYLDGVQYESANTSGGVGSLIKDLKDVPNVCYKTIRYPKHFDYVWRMVDKYKGNFDLIKAEFLSTFPTTDDDVIIVYAEAIGKLDGQLTRKSFYDKYYGLDKSTGLLNPVLTGIQSTTAGSGVAMLELMLTDKVKGIISHTDVGLADFASTVAFKKCYKTSK